MPLRGIVSSAATLTTIVLVPEDLLPRKRADGAYLSIVDAELGSVVEHGMNMESRVGGFVGQLPESMYKLFLKVICQVVLGTEKYDGAL